jgi:hypothetical protein
MGNHVVIAGLLVLMAAGSARGQDPAFQFFSTFSGRYHCKGNWIDFQLTNHPLSGPLGMDDPDAGLVSVVNLVIHRSVTQTDTAAYKVTGPYDRKSGQFRLIPKEWSSSRHPPGVEMIGFEGRYDFATRQITAKMLSDQCDVVEFAVPGKTLPPLPQQGPPATAGLDRRRPEMRVAPSNVTNDLLPNPKRPLFEYLVTRWYDPPSTMHYGEPIDEENEALSKENWACSDTVRVLWDPSGTKGTVTDHVSVNERYVLECIGDCKGLYYQPTVSASVTHWGLSRPLPTIQLKAVNLGGATVYWSFARTAQGKPPEILVHHWAPLTGKGPFDPGPDELARRKAAAPPCKGPR